MTNYQFTVVIEPDEGQFHAYAPSLPGCHSFGATVDEARSNIAEAIELYIEGLVEDGETIHQTNLSNSSSRSTAPPES